MKKRALGSHVLGPHPVNMYETPAAPANGAAMRRPSLRRRPASRRPQLNALLESWDDVARFRAVAYVQRVNLSDVLTPALELFVKTLPAAERRAIALEAKRIRATLGRASE